MRRLTVSRLIEAERRAPKPFRPIVIVHNITYPNPDGPPICAPREATRGFVEEALRRSVALRRPVSIVVDCEGRLPGDGAPSFRYLDDRD